MKNTLLQERKPEETRNFKIPNANQIQSSDDITLPIQR